MHCGTIHIPASIVLPPPPLGCKDEYAISKKLGRIIDSNSGQDADGLSVTHPGSDHFKYFNPLDIIFF